MSEPRMRPRQKGRQFPVTELESFLFAFGDDPWPLPETVRLLDEMATDYIIETCHEAAQIASYSRRQKIKVDDFKIVLRKDPPKLGRVIEYLNLDKKIKDQKRGFDADELEVTKQEAAREAKKDAAAAKDGKGEGSVKGSDTGKERPRKKAKTNK